MRLAITGTTGRVGRALADRLSSRHEVIELSRAKWDFCDPGIAGRLEGLDFDVLLNPAAITGLEACEDDAVRAFRVNSEIPGMLAVVCGGRPMLHFSTDYVFDGVLPGLRRESDPTRPLSVYGRSKLKGEERVLAGGGTVMRVSWVFGPEKAAFPDQFVGRVIAGERLAAVSDKYSLPTYTPDLCEWVSAWLDGDCPGGVFHACNSGSPVSWHGIAMEISAILAGCGMQVPYVHALALEEMTEFRAVRPRHTAMATDRLEGLLGRTPRSWREAISDHVRTALISR